MLQLQKLFKEMGFVSEIFAEHIAPGLQDRIHSIHGYRGSDSELLVFHHSIGHDVFDDVIALPNNVVVVYHNVTPERYFESDLVRSYIRLGRDQLALLARRALFGVADSNFNRRELLAAGFCGVADRIVLRGKGSDAQLRSAFAGAGIFVSVSEHEGFGVPILEAMAAGVPVVAFGAAAIPETLGGAGVLLRTKDPAVVAATVQAVMSDPDLRRRIVERQFVRIEQVGAFDTRRLMQRVIDRASGVRPPLEIQVQGPFETSYSLAVMNRQLALGLDRSPDQAVSIYATEGPGDYQPAPEDLARYPEAAALFDRAKDVPFPDVVIRQMYPPRVIDTPGGITCEYFGWEESRIPESMVEDFNRYLDGVGVMSAFVRDVLRDSGVNIPIRVVGNGVETPDPTATIDAPELGDLRRFTFLNIGSAFPRKGVDALLEAFFDAFDGRSDVTLVLKTFPNPHNNVGEILDRLRSTHASPPDVRWIDRDLSDREIQALHGLADCYVHPARGEGFGLPVAEAMAAGVPVISVAHSGLADFVSDETAITIPFTLEPAQTHFDIPDSVWAEPDRDRPPVAAFRRSADPGRALPTPRRGWRNGSGRARG